tara:strand:- start:3227 stop:4819 length:1593 start_codon:yes stop_codon:yes gene_type:complete
MDLGSRAYHHDESIHAHTAWSILQGAKYEYDPVYHGPFLYFAEALLFKVLGASDYSGRLLPAIFGFALVLAIPMLLRRELGRHGTWIAMLAITLSTGFMYFSRFNRNDIFVAFWTLIVMSCLIRFVSSPERKWVLLTGLAFGFSFATKENTYISGFVFVSFVILMGAWVLLARAKLISESAVLKKISKAFLALRQDLTGIAVALVLFAVIVGLFMSSFLINLANLPQSILLSLTQWIEISGTERVNQPWYFYLIFLAVYEVFALVFSLLILVSIKNRVGLFVFMVVYWAVANIYIYSVVGEKAPWISVHVILPLILLAAWCANALIEASKSRVKQISVVVSMLVLISWTARNSIPVTFAHGDVPVDFVIYTQTSRDVKTALSVIETVANREGTGTETAIYLESESHWPYAWYLREYSNVNYGPVLYAPPEEKIVLVSMNTANSVGAQFGNYTGVRFKLREWFPEHVYKSWELSSIGDLFTEKGNLKRLFGFYFRRIPPDDLGSTDFVMYLHKDLLANGPIPPFSWWQLEY